MSVLTLAVLSATPITLLSLALSLGNAPLKLPYLLAHTSDWGVLELPICMS